MVQITEEQGGVEIKNLSDLNVFSVHQCRYFKQCFCQQNPHVSFDPEHGEGFEDRSPFPFPVGKEWICL